MTCTHCNDTGSLSKDVDGYLDCGRCDTAQERAALTAWADKHAPDCPSWDLWAIYQHGKAAAAAAVPNQ